MISKLHFISQESEGLTHLQSIEKACKAGVDWVQLRVKNRPFEEVMSIAKSAKVLCDTFGVKLIVNDYALVAREVGAYGLHLGKEDMGVGKAREIVGPELIIGGTANTMEDIINHANQGANYIGCGPFRFTKTKQKLSPILGLEGYRLIMEEMQEQGLSIPIIAIGGIETRDISAIMEARLSGIAVSSLIAFAENAEEEVVKIKDLLKGDVVEC